MIEHDNKNPLGKLENCGDNTYIKPFIVVKNYDNLWANGPTLVKCLTQYISPTEILFKKLLSTEHLISRKFVNLTNSQLF